MGKKNKRDTVDFENVDIPAPTVDLGDEDVKSDTVSLSLKPYEYRTKKFQLVAESARLKNCEVAYRRKDFTRRKGFEDVYDTCDGSVILKDETVYLTGRCIDCFISQGGTLKQSVNKAAAASIASRNACVIFADEDENIYLFELNNNFFISQVSTNDDLSGKYGGLTYLETRGRSIIPDPQDKDRFFKIVALVSKDGCFLIPVKDPEDFIPGNAYYYIAGTKGEQKDEMAEALIYSVKSLELERYVTGVYYKGEIF